MKIRIESLCMEEVNDMIEYRVWAETATYKGYSQFYGTSDVFGPFARQLLKFPFESKKPVTLNVRCYTKKDLKFTITLEGKRGETRFRIEIAEMTGDHANFSEYPMETQSLHDLANGLLAVDFKKPVKFEWSTVRV